MNTRFIIWVSIFAVFTGCNNRSEKPQYHGNSFCEKPKYSKLFSLPKDLLAYYDYDQGLNCAKKLKRPVFLTFTGHGAICSHEMRFGYWLQDDTFYQTLNNNYVSIVLYVDDKTRLDSSEFYISSHSGKQIETIGRKNSELQITHFNVNFQPYSIILDSEGKAILHPLTYSPDATEKIIYLKKGLAEYEKLLSD